MDPISATLWDPYHLVPRAGSSYQNDGRLWDTANVGDERRSRFIRLPLDRSRPNLDAEGSITQPTEALDPSPGTNHNMKINHLLSTILHSGETSVDLTQDRQRT